MKAMAGFRPLAHQPEVRAALIRSLVSDANAGVRSQAIEVLVQGAGQNLEQPVVGALQEMRVREKDAGLRQRCERVLASFNASAEIY